MKQAEKERQLFRAAAQKTAQKVVQPRAADIDGTGEFPWDVVEAFGNQGFLSILLPEAHGGADGDMTSFCQVIEEIAKVSGTSSLIILAQGMGTDPILIGGSPAQKERYFTEVCEKNVLAAFAWSESNGPTDAGTLRMVAEKKGGEYVLRGRKCFVTHGSIAKFYSVFVVTAPGLGEKGISAFVVEEGMQGLHFGERTETMGMKGSMVTDLIFDHCRVPQENRLGEEGEGWRLAGTTINRLSAPAGALAVGIAQGAMDYAIQYGNERVQFGSPIVSFQAIRFMIADMATLVEAARALVYTAAAEIDADHEGTGRLSIMAKTYASDVAMKVTTDAVQILGGYGYMKDYPVERMMRDAKVTQIYGGANQVQRLAILQTLLSG